MDRGLSTSGATIRVVLSRYEIEQALFVAGQRNKSAADRELHGAHGAPEGEEGEALHVVGCLGEKAVAKHFNLYWNGSIDNNDAPDVGGLLEVRTRTKDSYDLLLRDRDKKICPYVLVFGTVTSPVFILKGWTTLKEGRIPANIARHGGGPPAYFVTQSKLHPMSTLASYWAGAL
jgi:hypothetical protein